MDRQTHRIQAAQAEARAPYAAKIKELDSSLGDALTHVGALQARVAQLEAALQVCKGALEVCLSELGESQAVRPNAYHYARQGAREAIASASTAMQVQS
jgi:hypothetical protein